MTGAEIKAKAIKAAKAEIARCRAVHGERGWADRGAWVEAHIVESAKQWAIEESRRPAARTVP